MSSAQQGPVRTCVGCRERAPKQELLRVVAGDGTSGPGPGGAGTGPWGHLHPTTECLALALRGRAFGRALRVLTGLPPKPLAAYLEQQDQ